MRKYTKAVIWIFGFSLLMLLNELVYWIVNGVSLHSSYTQDVSMKAGLTVLAITFIPPLFFKDDKNK